MDAQDLGRRLLGEVKSESLDELLRSFSTLSQSVETWAPFNIPPLDILTQGLQPKIQIDQTLLSSVNDAHAAPTKTPKQVARQPLFLELIATGPGQGKTHLLYYIAALAVLPATFYNVILHGKNSAIVVVDTDDRFDVNRLAQIVYFYVLTTLRKTGKESPPSMSLDGLVYDCLQHVHIFRPTSYASFLATLVSMPSYLSDVNAHHSTSRAIHSIMIDSTSSYLWAVKAAEDANKLTQAVPDAIPKATFTANGFFATMTGHLASLSRAFCCLIISTSWAFPVATSDLPLELKSGLPYVWANAQRVRLGVRCISVPQYLPGLSLKEALAEKERWSEVIDKRRFEAWLLGDNQRAREGFSFRILEEGIELEEWAR